MIKRPRRGALAVAALCCLTLVGCAPPEGGGGEGPGGRHQPLALTPEQELAVGRRAAREIRGEYAGRILPADSDPVIRVRRVMDRVVRAAGIEPLQREINLRVQGYRFEWQADVIREKQVNAFCLPAGKVFVFTGLLTVANRDDLLATVLSHEIAHALAHHASERIARESEGRSILGVLRGLEYDRRQEAEADKIGVFLMAFAGYDPNRAVEFWGRMAQARGGRGGTPEILSSHPSDESRARTLRRWAPRAVAAKQAYDEGRIAPPPKKGRGE